MRAQVNCYSFASAGGPPPPNMDQPLPPMHPGNLPNGMGGGPGGPPSGGAPGAPGDPFPPPPPTSSGGDFPPLGDLPPPTSQPSAQPPSASPDFQSNSGKTEIKKNFYRFIHQKMIQQQLFIQTSFNKEDFQSSMLSYCSILQHSIIFFKILQDYESFPKIYPERFGKVQGTE